MKATLIEVIRKYGLTHRESDALLKDIFSTIKYEVDTREIFRISDFGTFSKRQHKARALKLPSGNSMQLEARFVPKFKPAKSFRTDLNQEG